MPMYISQAVSSALMFKGKSFMIYTQQVHQGCLKVMNMYPVLYHIVTKLIRLAVDHAWFNPGAGHPHGETTWVVISAIIVCC